MTKIDEIKAAFEASGNAQAAIEAYSEIISDASTDAIAREQALIERGMLYWRAEQRANAINDYNAAIKLNPSSRALQLRSHAYEILDFYHRDLYNP